MCNEGNWNFQTDPQPSFCLEMGNSFDFLLKEEAQPLKYDLEKAAELHPEVLWLGLHSENPGAETDLDKHWGDAILFTDFERVNCRG